MMACPYGIPRYDWEKTTPFVKKCTMCYPRLQEGLEPACVEVCPEKATIFGSRAELIDIAHRRIKENPDRYVHKVFGETEIGGTSVLYISDISLDFLAFKPELGDKPLPQLTWAALSKVPPIVVGMGGLMTGVWWIINRRMTIEEEQKSNKAGEKS
jgi:formate dehydrogenase iron-sulfur subunit